MKKMNLKNKRNIVDDIEVLKEREPFSKLTDSEFLKIVFIVIGYLTFSTVTFMLDIVYFALLIPVLGLIGVNVYFVKEFIKLGKRKKAEKNMNEVVKALVVNDIKTNSNRLSNSTVKHETVEKNGIEESYSNCYLFLDKNDKLNGLYEEINIPNKTVDYYTLNTNEVVNITQGKRKVLTKTDTIIRR